MKKINLLLNILLLISLLFAGCDKKDQAIVSEIVQEVEEKSEHIVIEEEIIEDNTPLTKEEIEGLKANAATDTTKRNIQIYEAIIIDGGWNFENDDVNYTRIVGKPDGSWRRMSDEEAEAIVAQGADAECYADAKAELQGSDWIQKNNKTGTIYLDYYSYKQEVILPQIERHNADLVSAFRYVIEDMEKRPKYYGEILQDGGDTIPMPEWVIYELGGWDSLPENVKKFISTY